MHKIWIHYESPLLRQTGKVCELNLQVQRDCSCERAMLVGSDVRGLFLEPDPGPIVMVISVELFIHKPYETNTNWHCMHVTRSCRRVCYSCLRSGRACGWITQLYYHGNWAWVNFEQLPPDFYQRTIKWINAKGRSCCFFSFHTFESKK